MKQYTFIHLHENLAIFDTPPIYIPVALQAIIHSRHASDTSVPAWSRKSSSSLLCLFKFFGFIFYKTFVIF